MKYYLRNLPRYIFQWTWNLLGIFSFFIFFTNLKSYLPLLPFFLPLVYLLNDLLSALGTRGFLGWNEFFIIQLCLLTHLFKGGYCKQKEYFFKCNAILHLYFICFVGPGQLRLQYIFSIDVSKDLEKLINCLPE